MPRDHLSVSQMTCYMRCPCQYYYRYIKEIKIPPAGALALGKSFHSGLEVNFRQKIDTQNDLKASDVADVVIAELEQQWNSPERIKLEDETFGELKDVGAKCTKCYMKKRAPDIQPKLVEHEFKLSASNMPMNFIGFIDLADYEHNIIDNKLKSRSPISGEADKSLQLTAYWLGYQVTQKIKPNTVGLDCTIKSKTPKIVKQTSHRTESDVNRFLSILAHVADCIQKQAWFPNTEQNLCSPKWCGYWDLCHKEFV